MIPLCIKPRLYNLARSSSATAWHVRARHYRLRKKLIRAVGRGFIPGKKPIESTWALAPGVRFSGFSPGTKPFFRKLFTRAENGPNDGGVTPEGAFFQNQLNGRTEAFAAFFHAAPLPIGAGNLRRPCDKPLAVPLYNRGELVSQNRG